MVSLLRSILLLFLLLTVANGVAADESESEITPELALDVAKLYQSDPLAEDAISLIAILVKFSRESDQVLVHFSTDYFPPNLKNMDPQISAQLLGAYIAGNIEYQLENNVNENRATEGVISMLGTYAALKQSGVVSELPSLETWIEKAENGELEFD